MLTLHTAPQLRHRLDAAAVGPGAVLVSGDRILAVGDADQLTEAYPGVRVRHWAGVLAPGVPRDTPLPEAPTPRERVHALLGLGVTAVTAGQVTEPALRAAADRIGLPVVDGGPAPVLAAGQRADFVVLRADGACQVTVLAGRLVHRRA
ncbi:imidazolonepropionase-like domain-containing protein [Melissospora conviva]|uniref:imidazolonepropionase-like domain-containing protein n=1 Tax=Melissospora conviva TaxID=3388432 RepID=UPI003C1E7A7E